MAEATTIARPYAQAIFSLAKETSKLGQWSEMLTALTEVSNEDQIKALIVNPNIDHDQLADLIVSVCADKLDQEGKNFVKVLAANGRLSVVAEIAGIFEGLKNEAEKVVQAEVVSAFKLTADQKSKLKTALKKRLGCEVEINSLVDKSIIGGAIIRAGDMIIDGSVTAQLERLSSELSH